ncbi:hypothetical protein [Altererythrobacter ishigakiensis]|uniref:Uncharacterized protein n=1 Tax=Altererythrobacter ishigakiensis TaxID=476157 RepID=A0A562UVJ2_9SPHN|nr:hypothetical protein [Altererythrobacter ishigakiensis]TWJ09635.1 hypothetical protein JN10_1274 [Altererythrobacter ishigakiensis]
MSGESTEPTRSQLAWALAAAIPFLCCIALLGYSVTTGIALSLAIVWPLLQIFGYTVTLKMAKGDPAHYLVKTQVILHWMIVVLLGMLMSLGGS